MRKQKFRDVVAYSEYLAQPVSKRARFELQEDLVVWLKCCLLS